MDRPLIARSFLVLALITQPMGIVPAKSLGGEESDSWEVVTEWVAQTGVHKMIGHIVGKALGFDGKIEGIQRAFTNIQGEGHFAMICVQNDRHLVVLAHLDSHHFGTIWMTSNAGVLERTAVRDKDGARRVDNSVFQSSFDDEKQFFLNMKMDDAYSTPKPTLGWPSCFGPTVRLMPRNPDHRA
jgi:hypothetical protein